MSASRSWAFVAMAVFGGAALWLAWAGSRDPRALWLAGVFMTVASGFAYMPAGRLRMALGPRWTAHPWWNAVLVEAFVPVCLWCFVRAFPRVLHLERTEIVVRVAIGVTAVAGVRPLLAEPDRGVRGHQGRPSPLVERGPPRTRVPRVLGHHHRPRGARAARVLPACPVGRPERGRRVSRFALGLALGLGPLFLEVLAEASIPPFRRLMDAPSAILARLPGALPTAPVDPLRHRPRRRG